MSEPASKRRKVQHSALQPAGSQNDFASFSDASEEDEASSVSDESRDDEVPEDVGTNSVSAGAVSSNGSGQALEAANHQSPRYARESLQHGEIGSGSTKIDTLNFQMDELLERIRPRRGKRDVAVEDVLRQLKDGIEKIPARQPLTVQEAQRQLSASSKVAIPFPHPGPPKDAKYILEYAKPANVNVLGSFTSKLTPRTKSLIEVDLMVTMPSSIFQDKDFLNHRYFYKRAYYVACIAAGLRKELSYAFSMTFENFRDDPYKAIFVVAPLQDDSAEAGGSTASDWRINVIPCLQADGFSSSKLLPDKCCIRKGEAETAKPAQSAGELIATTFYNSSLRADMLTASYAKLLHMSTKSCPGFQDACLLGSSWLRQRSYRSSISAGGFGNFEWSALIALLLQSGGPAGRPLLGHGYSSYQLFKATLQLLAMKDFSKDGLVVGKVPCSFVPKPNGAPIVWDTERSHNLLYKMTPWSYKALRRDARTTLNMLSDQNYNGFEATFVSRQDGLLYRYDHVVELDDLAISKKTAQNCVAPLYSYQKLYDILRRGLGDRVTQLVIMPPADSSWKLESAAPRAIANHKLTLGVVINPETANRTVDHGPSAENKSEAASYREFWGEKAELRRFKDGSIQETLVWTPAERGPSVVEQIIRFLSGKHISPEAEQTMHFVGDEAWRKLTRFGVMAASQPLMEAYRQLETDIRALPDLPLSIRQIAPASAQLYHAAATSSTSGRQTVPADVVLQFEGSKRWPEDLVAMQRTKIAFLLKLRESLEDNVDTISARVGLENNEHDLLNQAFLDIAYDSGASFRLRIHHEREQILYERQLKDKTLSTRSKESAALGLASYKRNYLKAPAHTQAVARLCSRYPALSSTIILMKNWFASHLLTNHVAPEVIELLTARTFVQPWPWPTPSSIRTAFLRTLLWLSNWDWRSVPLVVDLSDTSTDLQDPTLLSIQRNFAAWRKLDPALNRIVLFAASNVDTDGTTWTDHARPARVVAGRMTNLAKAACVEIEKRGLALDPGSLFRSSLTDFDFVLHLRGEKTLSKTKRQNGFKNLEIDDSTDPSLLGYDPVVDFLRELEHVYGQSVMFFHGGVGPGSKRAVVAGLWNPAVVEARREWKFGLGVASVPVVGREDGGLEKGGERMVVAKVDRVGMVGEMGRLGGSLVERIEMKGL